jgi:hypothetical protein
MKKLLLVMFAAIATFLFSGAAFADTVSVRIDSNFTSPVANPNATIYYAFKGTERVKFQVAGKQCDLLGSASPIGAFDGCNYSIVVAPDGTFSGTGNSPCTQNPAAACK